MKILYVLKSLPDRFAGGIQTHTWKLSAQMSALGHEVHVLSAGKLLKREFRTESEARTVIRIPYFPGRRLPLVPTLAEEWAFNFAALKWLLAHAKNYDLVHLQGRSGFFFPGMQRRVPVVNTLHGLISVENTRAKLFHLDARLHQKWVQRWEENAILNSDQLIVVSQEMADELKDSGYNMGRLVAKTTQIYNGIDVPPPPGDLKTEPDLILFVGRMYRIKGVFPLVEAMKSVRPGVRLVMIGDGPDRARVEQAIAAAGLGKRITLTGQLAPLEVCKWMHRAAFVVAPSLHESQGIVLMEALSCGKTVLTTDIPGIRESIRHGANGLMVPPGNPQALAAGIHQLLDNPREAERMGAAGREMVLERFSWDKIAQQTLRVYAAALASKPVLTRPEPVPLGEPMFSFSRI